MPSKRRKMNSSIIKWEHSGLSNIVSIQLFRTCTRVWFYPPFQAQGSEFLILSSAGGTRGRPKPCSRWTPQISQVLISKTQAIQSWIFYLWSALGRGKSGCAVTTEDMGSLKLCFLIHLSPNCPISCATPPKTSSDSLLLPKSAGLTLN